MVRNQERNAPGRPEWSKVGRYLKTLRRISWLRSSTSPGATPWRLSQPRMRGRYRSVRSFHAFSSPVWARSNRLFRVSCIAFWLSGRRRRRFLDLVGDCCEVFGTPPFFLLRAKEGDDPKVSHEPPAPKQS